MKVLLVNPGIRDRSKILGRYKRVLTPVLPQGLAYIAAVLREDGHEVQAIDQYATEHTHLQIVDKMEQDGIEVLGIGSLTPLQAEAEALVKMVKERMPQVVVVFGNIHASSLPERTLQETGADFIVHSEGEATMSELLKTIQNQQSTDLVQGISFMRDGKHIRTPNRPPIDDLDALPFPAWDLFDLSLYPTPLLFKGEPMLPLIITRGCPFRCSFCSQIQVFSGKVRTRSVQNVVDEIEWAMQNFGIKHFGLTDAIFPYTAKSAIEFADEIIRRGLQDKIMWFTELQVNVVKNQEMLDAMKASGCYLVMLGIESFDPVVLKHVQKPQKIEVTKNVVRMIAKAKMFPFGLFIVGLPGETVESAKKTIEDARELPFAYAKFNRATPYPGSRLYHQWLEERGNDKNISWEKFSPWAAVDDSEDVTYVPEGMTPEELIAIQNLAVRRFYLKPSRIFFLLRNGLLTWKHVLSGVHAIGGGLWDMALEKARSLFTKELPGQMPLDPPMPESEMSSVK